MKSLLLCAASTFVLAVGATPARAQQSAGDAIDEVVVTGVRASVTSAQALKAESLQISDSIVAEDIGKLPDNTVSEALQRVTGVQITRLRGEANNVVIRGLPDVVTTINGRQIFTTTNRGVALADIPADLLKVVNVYKSATPEQFSGGLVGAVNVDLRRPFDFDGLQIAGALRGIYSEETGKTDPTGSVLFSNRWKAGDGEFGALISLSYQDKNYLEANTFDGTYDDVDDPFTADPSVRVLRPFVIGSIYTFGETKRKSGNLSLQWAPNDHSKFYLDGFYVKYDEGYELNFWIPLPGIEVDSFTLKPGTNIAQTWNSSNIFTLTSNQAFARESETYQAAVGGEWDFSDALSLKTSLAYTNSTADNVGVILDTGFIAPRMAVDFSIGGASDALITNADGTPFDVTDSSHYWMEQIFDQHDDQEADDTNFTADLKYKTGGGFFQAIQGGIQIGTRNAENHGALGNGVNRNALRPDPNVDNLIFVDAVEGLTGVPGIQQVSPDSILHGDRSLSTREWFVADREFLLGHADAIRPLFFLSPDSPPDAPTRFFGDQEDTYAVYAQTEFKADAGVPIDGVVGARYVKVNSQLDGFLSTNGVISAISVDRNDSKVLPSLNVRFTLMENLLLRFSASETMTRPLFRDLNPGTTFTNPGPTLPGQGQGGNPNLSNPEATNADISLEWYFNRSSSISTAFFSRDIDGYIQTFSTEEQFDNGTGLATYQVSRPQNTDAKLRGAEIAYTQFYDGLPGWLSGFGTQLNYTYVDADGDIPVIAPPNPVTFRRGPVTNVSKNAYNIILIYEKYGFSGRLAYNWRDEYIESYNQSGAQPSAVVVKDAAQMDLSLGYRFSDKMSLSFDATNLLDRPVKNFFGGESGQDEFLFPRDIRSNDRTFSLGVRVKM